MHPALHIGLPTTHLDEARRFYADLLGTPPDKERDDYLRFVAFDGRLRLGLHAVAVLAPSTSTAHLGLAVVDAAEVARTAARLEAAGWSLQREDAVTCCWALQDKVWVTDPDGHRWEVYTVLAEADVAQDTASTCCDTGDAVVAVPAAGQGCCVPKAGSCCA
ncbi:MAG: VOC family protein [Alphaproteobacteria bacterium]|nr:VOC family protein [Alphaproteobacteria bacterium]